MFIALTRDKQLTMKNGQWTIIVSALRTNLNHLRQQIPQLSTFNCQFSIVIFQFARQSNKLSLEYYFGGIYL